MTQTMKEKETAVTDCLFCDKPLRRDEIVRYRGAIACRECAEKAKARQERFTSPVFFILGGIGGILSAMGSIGLMLLRFPIRQEWIGVDFSLVSLGLVLIAIADVGLYFNWDRIWGFLLAALSLIGFFGGLSYIQQYLALGPMSSLEEIPPMYTLSFQVFQGGIFSMLAFTGALIILTRDEHQMERLVLAAAGFLLLGSALVYLLVPAFMLLSVYFFTAKAEGSLVRPLEDERKITDIAQDDSL